MSKIKYFFNESLPLEMHKVRIIQKLNLIPIDDRLIALTKGGNNTFLLRNSDVFLDMLTDSGTNAMSDNQLGAMMGADDSYAGSETFYRLERKVQHFFGMKYFLPAHQGRACENIIAQTFVKKGDLVPMNYHFTTTKAHISLNGGEVVELYNPEAVNPESDCLFKGDVDIEKFNNFLNTTPHDKISFVRLEMGTNLIGGQPMSLANILEVAKITHQHHLLLVIDASLLADNLHFIKTREKAYQHLSIHEIVLKISEVSDIIYFSGRKLGCAKGGGICVKDSNLFDKMKELVPLYEGFLTYGGMSTREMEALAVGLDETLDEEMINQSPDFIKEFGKLLQEHHVPIVTPTGGLGCHIDAKRFVPHIKGEEYPAGSLATAIYLISGVRGMERGTISETRNEDGSEHLANMELVRLAVPRRVFTLSQIRYAADRIAWLYQNRNLIGGLKFTDEPKILRFFLGKLAPVNDWQEKLVAKFKEDFGDSL